MYEVLEAHSLHAMNDAIRTYVAAGYSLVGPVQIAAVVVGSYGILVTYVATLEVKK
jgi:hypothetical protein